MTESVNWKKRLKYRFAEPSLKGYLRGLWKTSTLTVNGEAHLHTLLEQKQPFIPCYWHQQNLICALYLLDLQQKGLKTGFLVSPSRDGAVPAKIFAQWGAKVIRGSSSRTGAQAMRDLYNAIHREHISPANTPDGPRGPIFEFKAGPLMLAQMTQVPIVPIASAAARQWQLKSWDQFIIPKWFNRLAIHVGEPMYIEKGLSASELEPLRQTLQQQLISGSQQAKQLTK